MVERSGKKLLFYLVLPAISLYPFNVFSAEPGQKLITSFKDEQLSGWEEKRFKGATVYKVVQLDGEHVLQAVSENSASGIFIKIHINLKETPFLNWRWRIENEIDSGDEQTKEGDDYAARIYVVVDGGLLFWKSRALSYVWANQAVKDSAWDNAYAGKSVKMLAVRSSDDGTGMWVAEKRNVYNDLKQLFGEEIPAIDSVAIMTDTDDSKSTALSYYADVFFSAE